ncbi:MAG: phosphopyruvate hydratase [Conexivisphaerales archaeon]
MVKESEVISKVKAREILDSRGNPTIEVDVFTNFGHMGRADAPAGKSRGTYEAVEMRDGDYTRYKGLGVRNAIKIVNEIFNNMLSGQEVTSQRSIDYLMIEADGTEDKSRYGGNTMVATSIAVAKAAANSIGIPLYKYLGGPNAYVIPVPMFLYICGGKLAATDLDFQELSAMPVGAKNFSEALQMGSEVNHELGELLSKKYSKYSLNTGDEGTFSPPGLADPAEGFEIILKAIEECGYSDKFVLAMDAAANSLFDRKTHKYNYRGKAIDKEDLMVEYENLAKSYPLKSIEDPFEENDFESTAELTKTLGIQIVGDDLFVTNIKRLRRGIEEGAGNAILFKINQIGTLTEALDAARFATYNGYNIVVSERSAQTEDTWLAHISVALNAGQLKNGAPVRGERVAQFNELLRIEEELGQQGKYAGKFYNKFL